MRGLSTRVLVVDDDAEFRDELVALLGERGHAVSSTSSAAKARAALERNEFDVMFSDLRMGRRSGLELLALARERWPRLVSVMLTGRATVETAVRALQLGAFGYLRKPIRPDQVHRILELVNQQLALTRAGALAIDPVRYANPLAAEGGYEVLQISPPPVRVTAPRVSHMNLDIDNPLRIRDAVAGFVTPRTRAAVVLAAVEELLARHREEEISLLLEAIRGVLAGKGPLAVGYEPDRFTTTGALAVRASIVSPDANAALESLDSPIRRLVIRRLAEGPCTFVQAMTAAQIDDTSKTALHLRKLIESGLVSHLERERYRLTPRGRGAVGVLRAVDELDAGKTSGNRVFLSKPRRRAPTPRRSARSPKTA